MNYENEIIKFYPIESIKVPFKLSVKEIIKQFFVQTMLIGDEKGNLDLSFDLFIPIIENFMKNTYGLSEPLTIGEMTKLYSCYSEKTYLN